MGGGGGFSGVVSVVIFVFVIVSGDFGDLFCVSVVVFVVLFHFGRVAARFHGTLQRWGGERGRVTARIEDLCR